MLDLLKNIENVLFFSLWCISAALVVASVLTAVWLSVRRVTRNRRVRRTRDNQDAFEQIIQELLCLDAVPDHFVLPSSIRSDRTAVPAVLLKFFKLVTGEDADKLRQIIKSLDLEPVIQAAITWGNRGKRMRAFHVLSFLETSSSLKTISKYLYSDDKYVRLSVARCIARRQVLSLVSEVAEAITFAFPGDAEILSDVLWRFGPEAIPQIRNMANHKTDPTIIAAALETLVFLRPENVTLKLGQFMQHEDERVRAAAVALSSISENTGHQDLLKLGLTDESRTVKIRSLKIAARQGRKDVFADLYRLMNDPFIWVRYWAMQATINTGHSGETLLRSLGRQSAPLGDLAVDVLSEP